MTDVSRPTDYRIFQGKGSPKVLVRGTRTYPAVRDAWYWEPVRYNGRYLYSEPYSTYAEAQHAAELLTRAW